MRLIWATSVAVPPRSGLGLNCLRLLRALADARRGEIQKAGGAQLVDARQLIQTVETKMHEKVRRRHPEEWSAGAGAPPSGASPARLHQSVDRAFSESDAPYLFDLGAGDRLMVGDHCEGLERRA